MDKPTIYAFNRGLVSELGLGRIDLKRVALSAATHTNWMPRVLGSMMLRPGLGYIGTTKDNAVARHIPFVFSVDDTAILEATDSVLRVKVDDEVITRAAVTAAVTNGGFTTDVSSWTDNDESGAASSWLTGGYLALLGTGTNYAIRDQEVTVTETGTEHAVRIVVARGTVDIAIGSTAGDDDYFSATISQGTHSLAFTPTGNFHIRIKSSRLYTSLVDSVNVEAAGDMELPTVWEEADLSLLRHGQSGDVVFVACKNKRQQKIERRSTRSWSVVDYLTEDGPFRVENTTRRTIATSALSGDVTLTASDPVFSADHVGALFSLTSAGQIVEASASGENVFTDPIKVTGIGATRAFTYVRSGTFVASITLQRSIGAPGDWSDILSVGTVGTTGYNDGLDNQTIYYRFGVKTGDYTSGTADISLIYTAGTSKGVARITAVASSTSASAVVLESFGGTAATSTWAESEWSEYRGWPSSVELFDGRLWWAGKDKILGSESDNYTGFSPDTEGDSGFISRNIGSGPVDTINWLISAKLLLMGGQGSEYAVKSSSLDEPLTPTNFQLKEVSTQGTSAVPAIKVDSSVVMVQRSGQRIYELGFDGVNLDYAPADLTAIVPDIGLPSIIRLAVQRQPDTRIHCVRSDGKVAVLVFDKSEEVKCWLLVETDGEVEDAFVMPGSAEDGAYYLVKRTINGATKRYLERWALESEAKGGATNKIADSFIEYSGSSTATITGLDHLEGETVVVWGNSKDLGSYTVSSGSITISEAVTYAVVGLSYAADWQSVKLAFIKGYLGSKKRVSNLGLVLADTHAQGLKYGPDFDNLDSLPTTERYASVDTDDVWDSYDEGLFPFPGTWDTDARICLRATAPRPVTVVAAVYEL